MIYQPKLADILAIDGIVPTLKRNAVIPHMSVSVYGLVQFTIAVIAIQLELVGLHGIVFLSFMSYAVGCRGHRQATVQHSPTKDKRVITSLAYKINTKTAEAKLISQR
jgi:hypothetical protein